MALPLLVTSLTGLCPHWTPEHSLAASLPRCGCSGSHAAAQWLSSAALGHTPRTRQCSPMDHPRGVHITAIRAAFVSAIKMPRLAQSARHLGTFMKGVSVRSADHRRELYISATTITYGSTTLQVNRPALDGLTSFFASPAFNQPRKRGKFGTPHKPVTAHTLPTVHKPTPPIAC